MAEFLYEGMRNGSKPMKDFFSDYFDQKLDSRIRRPDPNFNFEKAWKNVPEGIAFILERNGVTREDLQYAKSDYQFDLMLNWNLAYIKSMQDIQRWE